MVIIWALVVGLAFGFLTGAVAIGLAFATLAAAIALLVSKQRQARKERVIRESWPDLVDDLHSSIRSGVALPEAIVLMSDRAPEPLNQAFRAFGARYRVGGNFEAALSWLNQQLSDPVAERVFAALHLTSRVGGTELGSVLRALSQMLREDARLRGELEARQSWTINAARLAVAAPWLVLAMMSFRPTSVAAYQSLGGAVVLGAVLLVSGIAYYLMVRAARLPDTSRTSLAN